MPNSHHNHLRLDILIIYKDEDLREKLRKLKTENDKLRNNPDLQYHITEAQQHKSVGMPISSILYTTDKYEINI